jgi:hypothetical protein
MKGTSCCGDMACGLGITEACRVRVAMRDMVCWLVMMEGCNARQQNCKACTGVQKSISTAGVS